MKIQFELNRKDYYHFNIHTIFVKNRIHRIRFLLLYNMILLGIFMKRLKTTDDWILYTLATIGLLFLYFGIYYAQAMSASNRINKNSSYLGERTLEFEENILKGTDKYSKSELKYEGIISLSESKYYFYLYLEMNMAIVIPKRVFKSKTEENEFSTFLKTKIN
jgi:hypothetical protein